MITNRLLREKTGHILKEDGSYLLLEQDQETVISSNGGIKFFEKNKFLYSLGARAFSMSGSNAQYILNHNRNNQWISEGSNDSIKEQIIVRLDQEYDINRLILNGHNFKDVNIYLLSESKILLESGDVLLKEDGFRLQAEFTAFAADDWYRFIALEKDTILDPSFIGLEQGGRLRDERFTDFSFVPTDPGLNRALKARDISTSTTYFEFDTTRVMNILIEVTEAQTVNAQKYLKCLIGTNEIGTFEGYPIVRTAFDRNIRTYRALSGKAIIQKGFEAANISLNFATYPGQADADLIADLQDSDDDFLIWLCGGYEGTDNFLYEVKGWDIDDLYLVNLTDPLPFEYTDNIYLNSYNTSLAFTEVTG